ncbi:unnamed protein product [Effrenium voratum]|nr:unnamed protein product [Effrenium voratum]
MDAFLRQRNHPGPKCEKINSVRWSTWRRPANQEPSPASASGSSEVWLDFGSWWRVYFDFEWSSDYFALRERVTFALRETLRAHGLQGQVGMEGLRLREGSFVASVCVEGRRARDAMAAFAGLATGSTGSTGSGGSGGSCVVTRVERELPGQIELRGGQGEPLFVVAAPEGRAAGLEGFELCAVRVAGRELRGAALAALRRDALSQGRLAELCPAEPEVALGFRSPLAQLPRLSEKQLAERLGFGRVREVQFRRLTQELRAWRAGAERRRGRSLRELRPLELRDALRRAGIHWLREPQQLMLHKVITGDGGEQMWRWRASWATMRLSRGRRNWRKLL